MSSRGPEFMEGNHVSHEYGELRHNERIGRRLGLSSKMEHFGSRHHGDVSHAESAYSRKQKHTPNDRFHLEFESLYDENMLKGLTLCQVTDQNKKLRTKLAIMESKMQKQAILLEDSLACTFVACPCSSESKDPNFKILFKLRKKVIELRDLVSIQECELMNMRKSMKFCKIQDLMSEIFHLRQEKGGSSTVDMTELIRLRAENLALKNQSTTTTVVAAAPQMDMGKLRELMMEKANMDREHKMSVSKYEREILMLTEKVKHLDEERHSLKTQCHGYTEEIKDFRQGVQNFEMTIIKLQSFESQFHQMKHDYSALQTAEAELKAKVKKHMGEIFKISSELDMAKESVSKHERTISGFHIDKLDISKHSTYVSIYNRCHDYESRYKEYQKKYEHAKEYQKKYEHMKSDYSEIQSTSKKYESKYLEMQSQYKEAQSQYKEMQSKYSSVHESSKSSSHEIEKWRKECEKYKHEFEQYRKYKTKYEEYSVKIKSLEKQIVTISEQLRHAQSSSRTQHVTHTTQHVERRDTNKVINTFDYENAFRKLFQIYAKNGELSKKEFFGFTKAVIKALDGESIDMVKQEKELQLLFDQLDEDRSGTIEWEEMWPVMNQWYMTHFGGGAQVSHQVESKTVVHHDYVGGKQIFNGMSMQAYLDVIRTIFNSEADRTGNVQQKNFPGFANKIIMAQTGEKVDFKDEGAAAALVEMFQEMDDDGNGILEWHEVKTCMTKHYNENKIGQK